MIPFWQFFVSSSLENSSFNMALVICSILLLYMCVFYMWILFNVYYVILNIISRILTGEVMANASGISITYDIMSSTTIQLS